MCTLHVWLPLPFVINLAATAFAALLERRPIDESSPLAWAWSRVDVGGVRPAAREAHAAVEVGSRIYVIGGCVQEIRCYNDVHIFDTDDYSWSQVPITGDAPEPRGGHSATLVGTDIFVFGGSNSDTTFGDVYKLDLVNLHWTNTIPAVNCPTPSRRANHAAAADSHGRIYVVGGYDVDGNFLNDVWILNVYGVSDPSPWQDHGVYPVVWEKPSPTGQLPMPRESHSLTIVDRKLVLFGGYVTSGKTTRDLHVYSLDTQEWSEVRVSGVSPPPRQSHSAARHGHDIVIAGGCSVSDPHPVCYNDVWSLNMVDMQWTLRSSDIVTWFAREGHSATFVRSKMFTFGGCRLTSECYNDVAVLDSLDPCPTGCGAHGQCMDDEFCKCSLGFTSHDCMQPLSCPLDCGGHGACSQSGKCVCENGWSGADCATDLGCPGDLIKCSGHGACLSDGSCRCFAGYSGPSCTTGSPSCPQNCSGHGSCGLNSQCVCHPGWTGAGCSTPLLALAAECPLACCGRGHCDKGACQCESGWYGPACAADKTTWDAVVDELDVKVHECVAPASSNGDWVNLAQRAHNLAELAHVNMARLSQKNENSQVPMPTHESTRELEPPKNEDFGVDPNPIGHEAAVRSECDDNCHFRGVCFRATCFCQPGYLGKTCADRKESKRGTVGIVDTLIIAGGCFLTAFIFMVILIVGNKRSKRTKESELGYNI